MKKYLLLPFVLFAFWANGQSLDGAWKLISQNGKALTDQEYIKIYQDDYFAFGVKNVSDNAFIGAGGGPFKFEDGKYSETLDFFTLNPLQVGTTTPFKIELKGNKLTLSANTNDGMLVETWEKISDSKDDLTRNWVITGRKQNDQISRSTPGARRTIKILSGGRFQWVAFNSETKEFSGTGGGTYTAKDGKYVETITFFSRDNSRVGASLSFDFKVIDGEWHHSGLSSQGQPIYEIWTPYAIGYKPVK
ncbi:hypothetical protein CLV31_11193 [Algoriphagus aquaeductus]|uniref:Membrane or secreted protein n=1 Tax=Algoriphagus aquaeductus TaxID=475299 RepID=A0A326RP73_9BACT|nr:hypothetical protein [Algoriphagus aquaeductus]PZV80927.1 hypothetical protein CLV31_11193 [Algoriphagus aquaeductus]